MARFLFTAAVFGAGVLAQAQQGEAVEQVHSSSGFTLQRAYPGGRDDVDLSVQPKKRVAKKAEDIELENFESGANEAPPTEGNFGE